MVFSVCVSSALATVPAATRASCSTAAFSIRRRIRIVTHSTARISTVSAGSRMNARCGALPGPRGSKRLRNVRSLPVCGLAAGAVFIAGYWLTPVALQLDRS
ncbi:hypothetical protein PSAB6_270198 [Paraburkholderia sabiae]|nr:hypothetical protein PSAB6_270198 [Paraburkholderia sabiae]